MSKMASLDDFLPESMQDFYKAEAQLVRTLQETSRASSEMRRQALENLDKHVSRSLAIIAGSQSNVEAATRATRYVASPRPSHPSIFPIDL